jgi:predicted  nucleic acid-binding Zn-ribbon protein
MVAPDRLTYWLKGEKTQNFGDYLGEFILKSLFAAFDEGPKLHLTGSVIDDGMIPLLDDPIDPSQPRASFWGCGIRTRGGLLLANKVHIDLFAVRGPVSASDLRLGNSVPIGDPGLLLPALYKPRLAPQFQGKAVCIPHFNDQRSDEELLSLAAGDLVLRSSIPDNHDAFLRFIDSVASAKFVLSASLHGAVAAAAYGRPFAFWDNGHLDLPTKWEDFASYADIEMHGIKSISDATIYYENKIAPTLKLPSLWPLLANAPCQIKPAALLKVLQYELMREGAIKASQALDSKIETFLANPDHFDRLAERTRNYSQKRLEAVSERLVEKSSELNAAKTLAGQQAQESQRRLDEVNHYLNEERIGFARKEAHNEARLVELSGELGMLKARVAELSRTIEDVNTHALDSERNLQESQKRLEEVSDCLNGERISFVRKEAHYEARLVELSSELGTSNARIAELSRSIEDLNTRALDSEQTLQKTQKRLEEVGHCLNEERITFVRKETDYETRLAELSSEFGVSNARIAELSRTIEDLNAHALDSEQTLQKTEKRLNEVSHCLNEERISFARKETHYEARLAGLSSELALSNESRAEANSRIDRAQVTNAELTDRLMENRSQVDTLRATLSRNELDLLLERNAKNSLDFRISRLEREMVARVRRVIGRQSLFDHLSGRAAADRRALTKQARRIADYVALFEAGRIMAPGEGERSARIVQFLLSASDSLPDLPFFDVPTYMLMYKESIPAGVNPLIHYLSCGPNDKQRPHILFDTEYYLAKYPDSAGTNLDVFAHYVKWGADKGYSPHPLFDTQYYFLRYPDVAAARVNPLVHYLRYPGCCPHPLFDTDYYLKQSPMVVCSGQNPLVHYLTEGAAAGLDPHPSFSSRFYLEGYHDVAAAGMNPLVHYLRFGAREGRNPHPAFSTNAYLDSHPQLRQSGENPLIHFVTENKSGNPTPKPIPNVPESGRNEAPDGVKSAPTLQRRTVLMVDAYYPRPDKDSGSLDQVAFVQIFQTLGYEVCFAADLELGVETPYREKLASMRVKCITYPEYQSIEGYLKRHANEVALCFLSRVHFGTRHIGAIRQLCPEASIIYNTIDLHHVRERRQAELAGDSEGLLRAKETYIAEVAATRDADATIVVSSREAAYWQAEIPEAEIFMVPLIRDYKVGRRGGFGDRRAIVFIGGFKHVPNIDAVTYFLDEVWPLVRAVMPDVEFRVIGADLPESLSTRSDPGVKFIGYVEDLEEYFAGIRLTVAPLRYGAGAKGKIVSSLAYGVPCVASSIASEGMGLKDGVNVMVGDSPMTFAEKIVSLYRDRDMWTAQSDNGMKLISERHSLSHGVDLMRNIVQSVVSLKLPQAAERDVLC